MASLLLRPSWLIMVAMLSLLFRPSLSNTQDLINKICYSTENYGFCAGIFHNYTRGDNEDVTRLGEISLMQTMVHGTYAGRYVTEAKNDAHDPETRDLYMICDVRYSSLLNEFVEASLEFTKKDYKSTLDREKKCSKFVADCQTVIGYRDPQLSVLNTHVRILISMSLITTSMLLGYMP